MRLIPSAVLALALTLGSTSSAAADPVDDAARAFRSGENVYVGPGARPGLDAGAQDDLRRAIRETGDDVFIADVPGDRANARRVISVG